MRRVHQHFAAAYEHKLRQTVGVFSPSQPWPHATLPARGGCTTWFRIRKLSVPVRTVCIGAWKAPQDARDHRAVAAGEKSAKRNARRLPVATVI